MFNSEKYPELDLNFKDDEKAASMLEPMVSEDWSIIEKAIKDQVIFIFGCGPSLKEDIGEFKKTGLEDNGVVIAVDGAVEALLEENVVPNFCVTDLDGKKQSLIEASSKGCVMIVHAHGDNIPLLKNVVPNLAGLKLGTTQVKPTGKLKNLGGFTDGDRAVYLTTHFNPSKIILFGMDFSQKIGEYSGVVKDKELKLKKMSVGRKLLEELAGETRINILNATSNASELKNIKTTRASELRI